MFQFVNEQEATQHEHFPFILADTSTLWAVELLYVLMPVCSNKYHTINCVLLLPTGFTIAVSSLHFWLHSCWWTQHTLLGPYEFWTSFTFDAVCGPSFSSWVRLPLTYASFDFHAHNDVLLVSRLIAQGCGAFHCLHTEALVKVLYFNFIDDHTYLDFYVIIYFSAW